MNYEWNIAGWLPRQLSLTSEQLQAWLRALLQPVQELHQLFILKNVDLDFRTRYNSQQGSMRALLNKLFDPTLNRIKVYTNTDTDPVDFVYFKAEPEPVEFDYYKSEAIVPRDYVYFKSEYDARRGFTVEIPAALVPDQDAIAAWVNFLRFQGCKWVFKVV